MDLVLFLNWNQLSKSFETVNNTQDWYNGYNMDQIFANPGFKHIAEKIIASMDSKSLVNFKQASKTIANHFRSYKTCMSFFERTLNESISQGKIWEYNFLNHLPVLTSENKEREEIMYFVECCHLNQYDCPHQHRNIPKGTVFEDLLLLHHSKARVVIGITK